MTGDDWLAVLWIIFIFWIAYEIGWIQGAEKMLDRWKTK
jgi:hypothetical protein